MVEFTYNTRSSWTLRCSRKHGLPGLGLLLAGFWLGAALPASATDIYVDAFHDVEKLGQEGTEQLPFKRLETALESVDPEEDTVVHVVGGEGRRYGLLSGEAVPFHLNVGRNSLKIVGTSLEPVPVVGDSRAPAVFEIRADESVGGAGGSVEFQNLRIVRADTGVAAVGPRAAELTVALRDCIFEYQSDHYAQFVSGEQGELHVAVENCSFLGASLFGLDLGSQPRSTLDFSIEDSRFHGEFDPEGLDPESRLVRPPRASVSIFLEAGARVSGVAERNRFQDPGVGMLVTGAESGGQPGRLNVALLSNSLVAHPESTPGGLVHGLQVAAVSHHEVVFQLAHNTLVGGSGFGVFFDDLPEDRAQQFVCGQRSFVLLGNIVHDFGLGEVSAEYEDGVLPDCVSLRGNALDRSAAIGNDGNIRLGDADLQWQDGLYGPRPDSALVDALDGDLTREGRDVLGHCRRADGDGDDVALVDIGALESPGTCSDSFLRGDCQYSGILDVTDAVHVLGFLFVGGIEVSCRDACDTDDSGLLDISDSIYLLSFLFVGGGPPPAPYPETGGDSTVDALGPCVRG